MADCKMCEEELRPSEAVLCKTCNQTMREALPSLEQAQVAARLIETLQPTAVEKKEAGSPPKKPVAKKRTAKK